jgi:hypothetical protein
VVQLRDQGDDSVAHTQLVHFAFVESVELFFFGAETDFGEDNANLMACLWVVEVFCENPLNQSY